MGLFVCSKCNCVENSALGWWWSRNRIRLKLPPEMKEFEFGKGLCSACIPANASFDDGTGKGEIRTGRWHGKFPRETVEEFMKESGKHYRRDGDTLTYIGK